MMGLVLVFLRNLLGYRVFGMGLFCIVGLSFIGDVYIGKMKEVNHLSSQVNVMVM